MPLLSIITITYNAEAFIAQTLNSILNQTSQEFEYILIDGASKDKTLEIVNKHKNRIDVLVSEPDKGLYDAMNKGQNIAKGDYVWFMNAGDEIADPKTVERLLPILKNKPDVVYSDTFMIDDENNVTGLRSEVTPHQVPDKLDWKQYKKGMLICHQSFIARKAIAPNYIDNNLSADIDWEIECLKSGTRFIKFEGILSKYLLGGISSKKKVKSLKDRYKVLEKHFGFFPNLINHFIIILRAVFK